MSTIIAARQALTDTGWRRDVAVEIAGDGTIRAVTDDLSRATHQVGVLLPALANLHSHSFQRAMAGLAEMRGPEGHDDFWSWRAVMYRFLDLLTPEDVEAIAAQVQIEMLEAGYACVGEFHYLHHQPGGAPYAQGDEMAQRLLAAARETGIGYTHLPVLYMQGGLDGRSLEGGQLRFGCSRDAFEALHEQVRSRLADAPADTQLGLAPHSLRAVPADAFAWATTLASDGPVHIHAAEQQAEVREVEAALGARPIAWLLANQEVDARWCLVHATQMEPGETEALARSGAVAGLCPITEANLGDGIFDGARFIAAGGRFGIGSDSNVRIALAEELRMLEYSQRLALRQRTVLANADTPSNGRFLYCGAALGGAQALGRTAGMIAPGQLADLVALDDQHHALAALEGDRLLDAWLFAADDSVVCDVWSAGRHVVQQGHHIAREAIARRFQRTITRLRAAL